MEAYLFELFKGNSAEKANKLYNEEIERWANFDEDAGKRIPYMGLFWQSVNIVEKRIPIGKDEIDGYVGVMANNKWYYPERDMSEEEVDIFIDFFERGRIAGDDAERIFAEMRSWFQTLEVDEFC